MNYKIKQLPEQQFAYMRRVGSYGDENYKLMANFKKWASKNNLLNENSVIYGVAQDNPNTTPPENCRYDVGILIDENFKGDNNIKVGSLNSEGQYLVFRIEHTRNEINKFWNSFMNILLENNYQLNNKKTILERYASTLINRGLCEMCIPLK